METEADQDKKMLKTQDPLLSIQKLNQQATMFKVTMESNAKAVMEASFETNPVTRLWRIIDASALFQHKL
jgi:hypothetical protein